MKSNSIFKAVLALLLVAAVFTGCQQATTDTVQQPVTQEPNRTASNISTWADGKGQIFGCVLDTKGEPVGGASVSFGGITTTTTAEGTFVLSGVPVNTLAESLNDNQIYTLVVRKDGYLSATYPGVQVVETTYAGDYNEIIGGLAEMYGSILAAYAENQGTAGIVAVNTDGTVYSAKDTTSTLLPVAEAEAELTQLITKLAQKFESTFVQVALTPLNAKLSGKIYTTTAKEADRVVFDEDNDKFTPAPAGVTVHVKAAGVDTEYVWTAKTDSNGSFSFDKLPANTVLTLTVDGFKKVINKKDYYYSSESSVFLYENEYNDGEIIIDENSSDKFCVDTLLFAQLEKIYVEETNLWDRTAVNPMALNEKVTFTFNKPMDYISLSTGESAKLDGGDLAEKVTYKWDDTKTKVEITPKDGYWKASGQTAVFKLTGRAEDGTEGFIQDEYSVTLNNVIIIKYQSTSNPEGFKLTFDREIANTALVTVTDDKNESLNLSWDSANKVLTVSARDNTFATAGKHTFTLANIEAVDGSTTYYCYESEYNSTSSKFEVVYDGFKAIKLTVEDTLPTAAKLSRAAVVYTSQFLKISFNKNVEKSELQVNSTTVKNYINGKDVYLPLDSIVPNDDKTLTISGTVTSINGEPYSDWTTVNYTANLKEEVAYRIIDTNLYVEDKAIAPGNDDSVQALVKGTPITLTFDKAFPTGTLFSAEFYKTNTLTLNTTKYSAEADFNGAVVTVTPSEVLEPGVTYYLSLKAVKGNTVLFTTMNAAFGNLSDGTSLGEKIYYTNDSDDTRKYIKVPILNYYVRTDEKAATTAFADFKKSNTAPIVLQFNQSVEGFKAYLFSTAPGTTQAYEDADLKNVIESTTTIIGDTITITPKYAYDSAKVVTPVVYNEKGEQIALKKDASTALIGAEDDDPKFVARTLSGNDLTKALDEFITKDNLKKIAGVTIVNDEDHKIDQGKTIEFTFEPEISKVGGTTLPTYRLYKKIAVVSGGTQKWEAVSTSLSLYHWNSYNYHASSYSLQSKQFNNALAYASVSAGATEFDFGSSLYVLAAEVDNSLIISAPFTVADQECSIITSFAGVAASNGTSIAADKLLVTLSSNDIIKELTVEAILASSASGAESVRNNYGNGIIIVQNGPRSVQLYAAKNSRPDAGNVIKIKAKDQNGIEKNLDITVQ